MLIDLNKLDNDNIKYPKEWRSREIYATDIYGQILDCCYVEFSSGFIFSEYIQLYLMKTYTDAFDYIEFPTKKVKLLHALLTKM